MDPFDNYGDENMKRILGSEIFKLQGSRIGFDENKCKSFYCKFDEFYLGVFNTWGECRSFLWWRGGEKEGECKSKRDWNGIYTYAGGKIEISVEHDERASVLSMRGTNRRWNANVGTRRSRKFPRHRFPAYLHEWHFIRIFCRKDDSYPTRRRMVLVGCSRYKATRGGEYNYLGLVKEKEKESRPFPFCL